MCGACGRTVVTDPVFPAGRSTRGNLIAGQMLDALCAGTRIRVSGQPDGFAVTPPGRRPLSCATVAEVWAAVLAAAPGTVVMLTAELEARYRAELPLLQAVVAAFPGGA
ncbi:hypothetical protein ACWEOE_31370 [Amycolatopsis sp. NPDC004368]